MLFCEVTYLPRWIAIALQLRPLCRVTQRPTLKKMHASVCNLENFSLLEKSIKGREKVELLTHYYFTCHAVKSMQYFSPNKFETFVKH
jgi:hypothetical protein